MTRWDALVAICGSLRAGLLGGERRSADNVRWDLAIEIASFHLVTPALAWCLRDEPMPEDVGEYFSSVAALNRQRNAQMLAGLDRVTAALNAVDIEPVLLKGCAILAEGLYPDPSLRMMGDADVLIPRERAADAVAALTRAGFATKTSDVLVPPGHHHLQMLHDPDSGLCLELHTDVVSTAPGAIVATDWFCEHARPLTFRNQRVRIAEPTRNAAHGIFHSQLFHGLLSRNKIHLRYLLDLALIRARHAAAIDWAELDGRFCAAGFGEALATYLHFAEALFGQPMPKLTHAPRPGALAELRSVESRDSFHAQIEWLKECHDVLQTELSRVMLERDRLQVEAERSRAADAALQAELDTVSRTHGDLERERARMLTSRSWRWTRPLRTLVAALRRLGFWREQAVGRPEQTFTPPP